MAFDVREHAQHLFLQRVQAQERLSRVDMWASWWRGTQKLRMQNVKWKAVLIRSWWFIVLTTPRMVDSEHETPCVLVYELNGVRKWRRCEAFPNWTQHTKFVLPNIILNVSLHHVFHLLGDAPFLSCSLTTKGVFASVWVCQSWL